jgi:hypothetical protein
MHRDWNAAGLECIEIGMHRDCNTAKGYIKGIHQRDTSKGYIRGIGMHRNG